MGVPTASSSRVKLLKYMSEKEKLEAKISEFGAILEVNKNVGMTGPLVDAEGFPRSDIDVYQVRMARQQIICLQNDYKQLMQQIEVELHKLHSETTNEQQELTNRTARLHLNDQDTPMNCDPPETISAIAKINFVSAGSPAEVAGLCVGDKIIEFGTINISNFDDLNQIAMVVRHMENQRVPLKVERENQILNLILIPKVWSGRGLLGCSILLPNAADH